LNKGRLISEVDLGVFESPQRLTNFLEGFLPLPLKWVKSKKIMAHFMLISDYLLSNKIKCLYFFLIWPIFEARAENPSKKFVGFFVVLKTPKFPFEIKWPLEEEETNIKQSQKKTHFAIYGQEKISFFKRELLLLASRASNVYFFVRPHMINIVVIAKHERILLCNTYLLTYISQSYTLVNSTLWKKYIERWYIII